MALKRPTLTVKALQTLLTRVGSATSGKKENLISRLSRDLTVPRLPICTESRRSIRVLSIDMGIKNLAFCVADVRTKNSYLQDGEKEKGYGDMEMSITSWRRLDVVEEVSRSIETKKSEKAFVLSEEEAGDPYSPFALSSTAYTLLAHTLLPYKPDIILIERQRWRSSGGVAIQQWTVRVNTLEGMLWAILTALRSEMQSIGARSKKEVPQSHDYEIFGVDPKRVGNFWIGENAQAELSRREVEQTDDELIVGPEGEVEEIVGKKKSKGVKRLSRGKAEKKAKIQLLRSWLTSDYHSTLASSPKRLHDGLDGASPTIDFTFSSAAEATRVALCATEKAKGGRKMANINVPDPKKLDDVTDCFLQAAAWVAWEMNRTKMVQDWDSEQGQLRSLYLVDSEAQEEMKSRGKVKTAAKTGTGRTKTSLSKDATKKPRKRANV